MFYYDKNLKEYEAKFSWDNALICLEKLFISKPSNEILNSLIGFSWYYLVEGAIESKKYGEDENTLALDMWSKYLRIGFDKYENDVGFCFIAGYTLLLHGFYIEEYKANNDSVAIDLLKNAEKTDNAYLKELVGCVLKMHSQKKYKPLKVKGEALRELFKNGSLLESYLKELFASAEGCR
ncbi:MAG: hypothetical protein E7350_03635 [Clostridiales bacterium]|nr:hypothetical protein [Clostridiales bacterium]